jgi:DNA mismatch repair ATPase MutS
LAFLDVSTGEFLFTELGWNELSNELNRYKPAEVVVDCAETEALLKDLQLDYQPATSVFDSWQFQISEAQGVLKKHFRVNSLNPLTHTTELLALLPPELPWHMYKASIPLRFHTSAHSGIIL